MDIQFIVIFQCVFNLYFLMAKHTGIPFLHFFVMCVFSSVKHKISFAHPMMRLLYFLTIELESSSYVLDGQTIIRYIVCKYSADNLPFHPLNTLFYAQFLILIKLQFTSFSFHGLSCWVKFKHCLLALSPEFLKLSQFYAFYFEVHDLFCVNFYVRAEVEDETHSFAYEYPITLTPYVKSAIFTSLSCFCTFIYI